MVMGPKKECILDRFGYSSFIMNTKMSRRTSLRTITGGAVALAAVSSLRGGIAAAETASGAKLKGAINHSACRWCYNQIPLDDLCRAGKEMGLQSIDLLEVKDFPTIEKYDLICAMVSGVPGGITDGLNRLEHHDEIVAYFERTLPIAAERKYPNIICFSGNRKGMSDDQGLENCAVGLKRIAPLAEKHGVNVCMELLNSRHNHPDYMCDHTAWGVELVKQVGSERFRLLYRYLSHADHGRRLDREDSGVSSIFCALSHRRRAGARRNRRDAGDPLSRCDEGDCRDGIKRIRRPGIRPETARCAGLPETGCADLRC